MEPIESRSNETRDGTTVPESNLPADLITVQRAATLVAADDSTIRRWIERGLIRGWRRHGLKTATLVSEAEVKAQATPVLIRPAKVAKLRADEARRQQQRTSEANRAYLKAVLG